MRGGILAFIATQLTPKNTSKMRAKYIYSYMIHHFIVLFVRAPFAKRQKRNILKIVNSLSCNSLNVMNI